MTTPRRHAVAFLATTALAIAAFPTASQSQGSSTPPNDAAAKLLKHLDTDNDGQLSLDESDAFALNRFDRLDIGDKGYLTLHDFKVRERDFLDDRSGKGRASTNGMPRYEATFRAINKSGTGHLTKEEYLAASRARFAAADTDKSGTLTLDELHATKGKHFWGFLLGFLSSSNGKSG